MDKTPNRSDPRAKDQSAAAQSAVAPDNTVTRRAELEKLAKAIAKERDLLEHDKAAMVERELAVRQAESVRDADYAGARAALDLELFERRQVAEDELSQLRSGRLAEIAQAEDVERQRVRADIAREREAWEAQRSSQESALQQFRAEVESQKGTVFAVQSSLDGKRLEIEGLEQELELREQRAKRNVQRRAENLDEEITVLVAERHRSFESELESVHAEAEQLRVTIRSQESLLAAVDALKQQLGDSEPAAVIQMLNSKTDEITRLQEELATRPTDELRARYTQLEEQARGVQEESERLKQKINADAQLVAQQRELQLENGKLVAENKTLGQKAMLFERASEQAYAELNRLRSAYERPAEVESRYREIENPQVRAAEIQQPPVQQGLDEQQWLSEIERKSEAYGLHFNSRILKAFHTALKTAEWSPLAILAGVSGTGKSELPRIYSHFGGLFFEPLAVQPNWDSQESMLGFFNSIDNKFDAQPVLRFLAQSQKPWVADADGVPYPGLADAVSLILLDEMNLAHPELYFAEFLSKLELRRGRKASEVPTLPVKIGAGMPEYQLPLGRNVLWAGTMNQDETTKSLSDKVLDRSIIIHFPRPTDLKRRLHLAPLDATNRGALLHKNDWNAWKAQDSNFTDEQIRPFKSFVEEINAALSSVGRAVGHRVWQSIEYYMANHPDVRAADAGSPGLEKAMHVAFEDQLVQKVMPKLRGIDTRGRSKDECLDKIRGQLITGIAGNGFNLAEDFDLAMELGYGQFMWQTANYLKADDADESA
ncbi:chromosome partitioning protein ParA [Microcella sp.]|uniref:chromosome partitioning protein ParA n=1 Tax=Microcella sp. TaxID=1913979 RepID=UPI00391AE8C9